jgi:putative Holliday junction resolvase
MSTILGIDLGERRIGVAIAESDGFAARPLSTLRRGRTIEADASAIQALIDLHAADAIVIGLPFEAAGQEGSQAAQTRAWVEAIAPLLDDTAIPITFQDERLSSHLAEQRLGPMPRGRSGGPPSRTQRDAYRARVDREAAAIILQDALDTRREPDASSPRPPTIMEIPS